MKIKWIIAIFFLSLIFLAPTFKVLGDNLELNQESKTEDEKSDEVSNDVSNDETDDEEHEDTDEDGIDDEREKAEERELRVEFDEDGTQVEIQSTLKLGESKNKFEFSLEVDSKIEFEFKFKNESASVESEVALKFEFRRIVEFLDNVSNPSNILNGLDDNDTEIQIIDFHDLDWSIYVDEQLLESITVYNIIANASDGEMVIEFSFFISTGYGFDEFNTTLLQPSSVKFNVEITNFPFNKTDSSLAVEVKIKHETETENDEEIEEDTEDEIDGISEQDEQQIRYSNSSVDAFFSWIKFYYADGVNKTVVVSPVSDDDEDEFSKRKMYFNFVQANKLFWDPKIGVSRLSTSQYIPTGGNTNTNTAIGFEFIALLLIPIVGLLRRRKNLN